MKAALPHQQGFTLIEVLVAVVLSSIVLLGLAAGELKSLQYANNSFNYTVSLVQANNVIERTWSNLCALQQGDTAYDNTYGTANFTPQIDLYNVTVDPAPGDAFVNTLDITVDWIDARMANNDSIIRLNATYPQICN